jgi:hypothetical protein
LDPITLPYGADEPLVLECLDAATPLVFEPPAGESGAAAGRLVTAAVASPPHGPPLSAHVVPGDRVVVALAGAVPQASAVVSAVTEQLVAARVEPADITVIQGPPLGPLAGGPEAVVESLAGSEAFDPTSDSATAYLAADEAGRPMYLARQMVDADVVVAVGGWGWNAAFAGRSLEGELWPTFSRAGCRHDLAVALARRGRNSLTEWRSGMQEIAWQLGVCASLRLVRGREGTLAAASFGLPDEAGRRAREAAAAWCPHVARPVDLTIATLSDPHGGFGRLLAAVAAAARATRPSGTICVASRTATPPGVIFQRWRQGAPLEGLVHEALASGDQALVVDALLTRLFARALDERRLVLLSDLDEETVEELEFGYASSPEVVERLAHRAESLAVLPEADLTLPRIE